MKFYMNAILLFLFFLNITCVFGEEPNNKKGFWITPENTHEITHGIKDGEDALFKGDICIVKWGEKSNKDKCLKAPTTNEKLHFRAFFPDSLHEVTDKLIISQDNDKKSWSYSFKAEKVSKLNLNQFTLIVGTNDKRTKDLLSVKAKIEKRISILKIFQSNYSKSPALKDNSKYVLDLIVYLEKISSRIDTTLANNPEILAELRQPLQVDNNSAAQLLYSSNFSGYKLTLKTKRGSVFEGEKVLIEASLSNLTDKNMFFPLYEDEVESNDFEEPSGKLDLRLSITLDGQNILTTEQFTLGPFETKLISVETKNLSPFDQNRIGLLFERSSSGKFENYHISKRRLGYLQYQMPVLEDNSPPIILALAPQSNTHHRTLPFIEFSAKELFGRFNAESIKVKLVGTTTENVQIDKDITSDLSVIDLNENAEYSINGYTPSFSEGSFKIVATAKDTANNNSSAEILNLTYDTTKPALTLFTLDNVLTNNPEFKIKAFVFDRNAVQTSILQNGQVIFTTQDVSIEHAATLKEGLNSFEVQSIDQAGNLSEKRYLQNIVLDTIPPALTDLVPTENQNIYNLNFTSSGKSDERLSTVKVNGIPATLSADKKSFSTSLKGFLEGPFAIEVVGVDEAYNSRTVKYNINIVLKVLNIDLISISPHPENADLLIVNGAPGATRPGSEVTLNAGFFNRKTFLSNANDGSFEATLEFFDSLDIKAIDLELNRTETGILKYNVDTTLAGVIKDSEDKPLSGVKVTVISSGQQATTDGSGSFRIPKPATGDQILSLDGTQIPIEVSGPNKKYSRVNIAVSIGTRQSNVLDKPIYIAPLMFDGSETIIEDENSAVVVESPHAPGVTLEIPAGVATFPNSQKAGAISVAEINAEYTAVPVLEFARPNTVYAFEPSGLKFSEPVKLTLPNVNEIPVGVQMVILSKNSEKGIWEIDGLARVSENGADIVTEDGGGITHFSEVYAVPLGPKVTEYGGTGHAGADVMNGSLQNSIELPSYKVMGSDISPSLSYQSIWANPSVVVSNVLDVPRNEYEFNYQNGVRNLIVKANVNVSGKSWIEPEKVEAQFYTGNLYSQKMSFTGLPQKAVISYAMNLDSLTSGIHTYNSHYDIHLKQLIVGTRTIKTKKLFGKTRISQEAFSETRKLEEVFPQDLGGALHLNNLSNSLVGKGWRINGAGKIHSVNNPRVLIEESNGGMSSYAVDSKIETLYSRSGLSVANFDNWPNADVYRESDKNFSNIDLSNNQLTNLGTIPNYKGKFEGYSVSSANHRPRLGSNYCTIFCSIEYMSYEKNKAITALATFIDNRKVVFTAEGGIEILAGGTTAIFSGKYFSPSSNVSWWYGVDPWPFGYCPANLGTNCFGETKRTSYSETDNYEQNGETQCKLPVFDKQAIAAYCKSMGVFAESTGSVGVQGYAEGSSPSFNNPLSSIKYSNEEILLADSGNNRVRAFNINTNISRLIAGNGQTHDNGDGGSALSASIYHPRGLAKDLHGNVYVTTERGLIRKIDPNGFISTFAGKINGVLNDKSDARDMRLSSPYGMVVDSTNNFLYVADTGHHRVVRIDLLTREAVTIAGSGTCQSGNIGDNQPAIFASLCNPTTIGLDDQKNLLIFDKGNNRIRRVVFESSTNGVLNFKPLAKDNSTLSRLADGSFVRTFRNGSTIKYNSSGRQIFSEDKIGNKVSYQYYSDGSLAKIIDPTNRETTFLYSNNQLSSVTDPQNRETEFFYDGNKLSSVVFPDGSERSFEYDENGLMKSEIDKRGSQTNYQYNSWNRLQKVLRANNTSVTIQDGLSSTIGNNYVSGQKGTLKSVGSSEIEDGLKDSKGQTTSLNKDENGFVSKIKDASGGIFTVERDLDGRPTKITRPDDTFTTFTYDNTYHDLVSKTDSLTGVTTTLQYNQFGNLISQSLPNGEFVTFDYDEATGLLLRKNMPLSTSESYQYYPNGLLKNKINTLNQASSYLYGSYGNLVTLTDNMNQKTQMVRDLAGNVISVTNAKAQTVEYGYDLFNRLKNVKSAKNETTNYNYLPTGELETILDPVGSETKFEYDVIGQLRRKIDPLGLITELNYDGNGNLNFEKDPKGNIKQFEYDSLDRLKKKILPDDVYEYGYDIRGNLNVVKNSTTQINYEFLHLEGGDVVSKESVKGFGELSDLPQSVIEYDYDESGNRIEMATTEGNFFYTYDKLNRLTKIVNHKGEEFEFAYDSGSRRTQYRSPATTTNYQFDDVNFLTHIENKKRSNNSVVSQLDYVRDSIGNITKITSLKGDFNYGLDSNNQLISATHPEDLSSTFSYDPLGNRVTDQDGTYSYDTKKQKLEEDWRNVFIYDLAGNLTSKVSKADSSKVTNYDYNSQNQLIGIKEFNGSEVLKVSRYFYDVHGRRVKKSHTSSNESESFVKKYVYDKQEILLELNENNSKLAMYTHSMIRTDNVLAMERSGSNYYYLKDHNGSINEIINNNGNLVQRYVYSAFGKLVKIENDLGETLDTPILENVYTYTGREMDFESGQYYYRARYYDPEVGRFLTVDPDSGNIRSPGSMNNKYNYVGNNPLNYTDPSGAIKLKTAIASYFLGPVGMFYAGARETFLNNRHGDRLDNVVIAANVVVGAFYVAPVTAAVASGVTLVQNRNKKGNFFDNLDDFTTDFAFNFGVSYALNGGSDIDPNSAGSLFGLDLPVNALASESAVGLGGVFIKETLCNNKKHIPGGVVGATLDGLGFVADRGRTQCD